MTQEHENTIAALVEALEWYETQCRLYAIDTTDAADLAGDNLDADGGKRARAALSAMPPREVTGWQPIETAPKDGIILAVCMEDYTQLVIWDQEIDYGEEGISQIWRSVLTDGFVVPTHWMPLPTAPEAK